MFYSGKAADITACWDQFIDTSWVLWHVHINPSDVCFVMTQNFK